MVTELPCACVRHICVEERDMAVVTAEPTNGMCSVLRGLLASSTCAVNEQVFLFNEGEALSPLTNVTRAAG